MPDTTSTVPPATELAVAVIASVFVQHQFTDPTQRVPHEHCLVCGIRADQPNLAQHPCRGVIEISDPVKAILPAETHLAIAALTERRASREQGYCIRCRRHTASVSHEFCVTCAVAALVGTIAHLGSRLLASGGGATISVAPDPFTEPATFDGAEPFTAEERANIRRNAAIGAYIVGSVLVPGYEATIEALETQLASEGNAWQAIARGEVPERLTPEQFAYVQSVTDKPDDPSGHPENDVEDEPVASTGDSVPAADEGAE